MTDDTPAIDTSAEGSTRRAVVTTDHGDQATAERVAAAVRPDNTPSMTTDVDGDTVRTVIERDTTGGLQSSVDDYVVNVTVAAHITDATRTYTNT